MRSWLFQDNQKADTTLIGRTVINVGNDGTISDESLIIFIWHWWAMLVSAANTAKSPRDPASKVDTMISIPASTN